ncbi:MAG: 3-dehydroquinate synthase [Betaproteobacteria bacterium]|mgnify:CR=1 FL=1|nr:3-dehydroquinate synthase [Betaproteobacteria bacterium]
MRSLTVALDARSYPIHIGAGLLARPDLIHAHLKAPLAAIVSNEIVAPLYLADVSRGLREKGVRLTEIVLPDGEAQKNWQTLNRIYDALLDNRCERATTIIALGGGVIGDLAGFAAATYQRGVPFIQLPTTLLAQVDSSVGGKTGINHPLGKNMIGAFHQPRLVLADTDTLITLPDRELCAGLAEVIKYGLIRDPVFFDWIESNIDKLLARDTEALIYAIERSCANKAEIVAQDERESGVRALLNLGHTFGHAIEAGLGFGNWLHGEAVAAGTVMAAELSRRLGWLSDDEFARTSALLQRAGLPTQGPALGAGRYLELMALDKKVASGKMRLVLLRKIGGGVISAEASVADVRAAIEACCNG